MHDRADAAVVQTAAFMEHSSVAVKPAQEGKTARLYNWLDAQPWKDWTRASRIAENPELLYKEPAYDDTGIPLELAISVYPTQFVFDTAGSDGGGAVDSEGMLATESDQDSIPMRVKIAAITKAVIESNADTVIARYDTLNALTPSKLDELVARATLAETSAKAALDTANRSKVDEDIEEARKTHANAMAITKILYAKQRQPKKRSVPAGGPAAGPKRAKTPTDPTDQDNVQRGLESVKDFIAEIVSGGVAEGCHLPSYIPWVRVPDEDFPGHAPDGVPPLFALFLSCLFGGSSTAPKLGSSSRDSGGTRTVGRPGCPPQIHDLSSCLVLSN